jgi:tetratricopeptide (TPR) repeat protein
MRAIVRLAVVALLLAAGAQEASAVSQGRMFGVVRDAEGKPVADAKIIVTCPALERFRLEVETGKQGKFSVAVVDAAKTYVYRVEKEGFQPLEEEVKIPIGGNIEHNFTLLTVNQARIASGGSAVDPAVEIYNAGVQLLNAGDNAGAEAKFLEATTANPQLVEGWTALASTYLKVGKHAEAAEAASKALAIDALDPRALAVQVDAYRALGDTAKAQAAADALAKADPSSAGTTLLNEGVNLFNAGQIEQATGVLERARAADPSLARVYYMLGLCYSGTDTAKAKESLQKFLELAPNDPDAATAKEMLSYL